MGKPGIGTDEVDAGLSNKVPGEVRLEEERVVCEDAGSSEGEQGGRSVAGVERGSER
jgi:hypothetical protein